MSSYNSINAFMIKEIADALIKGDRDLLNEIVDEDYPINPYDSRVPVYTVEDQLTQFLEDGFIDRYTGEKLFNPGMLKVLSHYYPMNFRYYPDKKTIDPNDPYWLLTPAIDCMVPIPFGRNEKSNWTTTSQIHHVIKGHYRLPMLGWDHLPKGDILEWNGMTREFIEIVEKDSSLLDDSFICDWYNASIKLFMGGIYADDIIFDFQCRTSYGGYGQDGGYGLTLRENGKFVLSSYILDYPMQVKEKILICDKNLSDEVKKEIDAMRDELMTLPTIIDNQVLDGPLITFRFGKIIIYSGDLCMYTLDEIKQRNPDRYEQIKDTVISQNKVLRLYDRVAEIINRYHTELTLSVARDTRYAGISGDYRKLSME